MIQNLLNTEIGISKDLTDQNTKLKLRIQSLETYVDEIINVEQAVRKTAESKVQESFLANNELIVPSQATSSADNRESSMDCTEQSIKDQWKEVRIKKHDEFVYLKSMERKKLESQERNVHPSETKQEA